MSSAYSKLVSISFGSAMEEDRCSDFIARGFIDSKKDSIVGGTNTGLLRCVRVAGLL